mmetsp:Transcript_9738/g.27330  ORF Transcript_9738/g.27330 Transcript_9738/m.27330 type:complete len:912 (-) Transcript_9738:209-2944(-)
MGCAHTRHDSDSTLLLVSSPAGSRDSSPKCEARGPAFSPRDLEARAQVEQGSEQIPNTEGSEQRPNTENCVRWTSLELTPRELDHPAKCWNLRHRCRNVTLDKQMNGWRTTLALLLLGAPCLFWLIWMQQQEHAQVSQLDKPAKEKEAARTPPHTPVNRTKAAQKPSHTPAKRIKAARSSDHEEPEPQRKNNEAPLYSAESTVEQDGALIKAGGDIWLYSVGSSNILWMTWMDQLHLYLKRLGYKLPIVPAKTSPRFYPKSVPACDDTKNFEYLKTARFGRIGWSSWDFAYEGWDECKNGWRQIRNYSVKCQHGPGCHYSKLPLKISWIAKDASKSNITLLATWYNDYEQAWSNYKCFGGQELSHHQVSDISISALQNTVRQIHAENPNVWVVIMGKYSQLFKHRNAPWLIDVNARVKHELEKEPRTIFVDYRIPSDDVAEMYQTAHRGHPNCRGSKIMAHGVLEEMFKAKILQKSIKTQDEGENRMNPRCSSLSSAACHTSALCWVDLQGKCQVYSAGTKQFHTVCLGSVCASSKDLEYDGANDVIDPDAGRVDASPTASSDKHLFSDEETLSQGGAPLNPGDNVWIYSVGSSNVVWMTWLDQLHLYLQRLGFRLPIVAAKTSPRYYATSVPMCDDTKHFEFLKTARFGRIGWSSWDFAYEGWDDCKDGVRQVLNYTIKCQHGPGCHYSKLPLRVSWIAKDASKSNITLLATWFNDYEQHWSNFKCFGGKKLSHFEISQVTIINLKRTVRAIHALNPNVWVLVMAKYSELYHHVNAPWMREVNTIVKNSIEQEPRTLFVDFEIPDETVAEMFQTAHKGHPNCRGSKIMAQAAMQKLYDARVIGKTINIQAPTQERQANRNCQTLNVSACHTSALCWVDLNSKQCMPYSAGTNWSHTVCEGSVCANSMELR